MAGTFYQLTLNTAAITTGQSSVIYRLCILMHKLTYLMVVNFVYLLFLLCLFHVHVARCYMSTAVSVSDGKGCRW